MPNQRNQTQLHKVYDFDFWFVSKCLHSRINPAWPNLDVSRGGFTGSPAFVMNLKWLSLGKRCSRNWFFFFLLSVTYILCKKGPLGQKTNFKGITVKGKHALGQLLFYSLLLDMFFVSSKDLATYKKVGKCNAKNLLKTYYKNFKKFQKLENTLFWVTDPIY